MTSLGGRSISIAVDIAACTKEDAFCVLQVIVNNHGSLGANLVACGRISLARRHFFSVCFRESAAAATEHLVRHHSTAVGDIFFTTSSRCSRSSMMRSLIGAACSQTCSITRNSYSFVPCFQNCRRRSSMGYTEAREQQ